MSVCCECCVLLGTGLCDELITVPDESYRLWCVVMCGLEIARIGSPLPIGSCRGGGGPGGFSNPFSPRGF